MSGRKPPPRTHAPEEERKIQQFLERAAPIVLECRVLDTQHWRLLTDLAEELEMNREQLRETVEDLRQRGVIEKIDIRPPTPPPLPHPSRENESSAPDGIDAEFALTAPPPFPPSARAASQGPPSDAENRKRFTQRVREIVAEHRGMSAKAQPYVAAAAKEFGISDDEVGDIVRGESLPEGDDADGDAGKNRWRIEGRPAPEAPRAKAKPEETFRSFVAQSLVRLAGKNVARETENSIVKHGVKVLRLAEIYARHLLLEVAAEKGLTLDSQNGQHNEPTGDDGQPPENQEFCNRAASILAEHRGITPKSRVLLTALGREYGLNDRDVERAVASMQKASSNDSQDVAARRREQRLVAFRKDLGNTLKKLPRKILLPNTADALAEQGHERYGLESELVTEAISQAAIDLHLIAISNEEAIEHISGLIDLMLGNGLRLRGEHRNRVFAEAAQWGVSTEKVERLLNERSRDNYRRRRSEQKLANIALIGAASAITLVIGFGAWTILDGVTPQPRPAEKPSAVEQLKAEDRVADLTREWWSGDLSIAVFNCETEFPLLEPTLRQIAARDAATRGKAYTQLVDKLFDHSRENRNWQECLTLFSLCYALDPDDTAAEQLADALLDLVPSPEDQLVADPARYPNIFWRLRTAVAALAESAGLRSADQRVTRLASDISRKIGADVDENQPLEELERECLGGFCESLFRSLIDSVDSQPSVSPALHGAIAFEATKHLSGVLLDNLNADFLVAILSKANEQWQQYEALIQQTIDSVEPLVVAKLVEVFQTTANSELRGFMEPLLRARTGVEPTRRKVPELAEQFLRSLGVQSDATAAGRQRQFERLLTKTLKELRLDTPVSDVLLRDTVSLARLTTLACALSQDDAGADMFRELIEKGPVKLAEDDEGIGKRERRIADPSTMRRIEKYLKDLSGTKKRDLSYRVSQFANLAGLADQLLDIPAPDAAKLAEYLVRTKHKDEFDRTLERIGSLGNWPSLILAVADKIPGRLDVDRVHELVARLVGSTIELGSDKNEMRIEILRYTLLQHALRDVRDGDSAAIFDLARRALYREHLTQVDVLGGTRPSGYPDETEQSPSTLLQVLARHQGKRLRGRGNREATEAETDNLDEELIAIEHWSGNDIHETVILQRVWLRLLARDAAVKERDRAASILSDLERRDAEARSMLTQLRDGQKAILQIWSLIAAPGVQFE